MSFKRRGDAEEAKAALHDTDYEGYRMVLGWSKAVKINSAPFVLPGGNTRTIPHPSHPSVVVMNPSAINFDQNHDNMREGDWICEGCGGHNYASKTICYTCRMSKDGTGGAGGSGYPLNDGSSGFLPPPVFAPPPAPFQPPGGGAPFLPPPGSAPFLPPPLPPQSQVVTTGMAPFVPPPAGSAPYLPPHVPVFTPAPAPPLPEAAMAAAKAIAMSLGAASSISAVTAPTTCTSASAFTSDSGATAAVDASAATTGALNDLIPPSESTTTATDSATGSDTTAAQGTEDGEGGSGSGGVTWAMVKAIGGPGPGLAHAQGSGLGAGPVTVKPSGASTRWDSKVYHPPPPSHPLTHTTTITAISFDRSNSQITLFQPT